LFTAVTAAGSSQLVSVSSLVTYDVFRTYLKPSATGRELIRVSRLTILGFGIGMGFLTLLLYQSGVSLQYVYLMMGIMIGSAVAPISFAILWKKTHRIAATSGAIIGLVCGITTWLFTANSMFGELTLASTGNQIPLLYGNIASILTGLLITIFGSLIKPENFDFGIMHQKILVVDDKVRSMLKRDTDEQYLKRSLNFCIKVGFSISIFFVIVWPATFILSNFVFDEQSFSLWITLAIVWASAAGAVLIILPFIEARKSIAEIIHKANVESDIGLENSYNSSNDLSKDAPIMRVLVPVDGSASSLRALHHSSYLFKGMSKVRIYLLHVIEWTDEDDENIDEALYSQIQEEGRLILRSIVVPKQLSDYQRIVKLGNPSAKIVEVGDNLNVDMIIMGKIGIGKSDSSMGHVSQQVVNLTKKPVVFID
jgi:nucleotide-binding universal stress UspA family protein